MKRHFVLLQLMACKMTINCETYNLQLDHKLFKTFLKAALTQYLLGVFFFFFATLEVFYFSCSSVTVTLNLAAVDLPSCSHIRSNGNKALERFLI